MLRKTSVAGVVLWAIFQTGIAAAQPSDPFRIVCPPNVQYNVFESQDPAEGLNPPNALMSWLPGRRAKLILRLFRTTVIPSRGEFEAFISCGYAANFGEPSARILYTLESIIPVGFECEADPTGVNCKNASGSPEPPRQP